MENNVKDQNQQGKIHQQKNLITPNTSRVEVSESTKVTPLVERTEEHVTKAQCNLKTFDMTSNLKK